MAEGSEIDRLRSEVQHLLDREAIQDCIASRGTRDRSDPSYR
jgi:hypothetical protein